MQLRPYQQKLYNDIQHGWSQGYQNIMAVLPTGGGKTVVFSKVINDFPYPSLAIAHRQELISQVSLSLGKWGIHHRVLAPPQVIKIIAREHFRNYGKTHVSARSSIVVASVDTLVSQAKRGKLGSWINEIRLCVMDEGHHILDDNKWGSAFKLVPRAYGLAVTATPRRTDGIGLGRGYGGLMDLMVQGPSTAQLINWGFLSKFKVYVPPASIDTSSIEISKKTGDYSRNQLVQAAKKSTVVGDVVKHYLKLAPGKLGITFVPSVDIAIATAEKFNSSGVPAAAISAKTQLDIRSELINRFRRREILQLVNVAIFGEGFDLPAIEVVSMAVPTQSLSFCFQAFGRGLRPQKGKAEAVFIDHAGNLTIRHGMPDWEQNWSLTGTRGVRSAGDEEQLPRFRTCTECMFLYEVYRKACPECGAAWVPSDRSDVKSVDGDLELLSPDKMQELKRAMQRQDKDPETVFNSLRNSGNMVAAYSARKKLYERKESLDHLRYVMNTWATRVLSMGDVDVPGAQRLFFSEFGVDVLSAQSLSRKEMDELAITIYLDIICRKQL